MKEQLHKDRKLCRLAILFLYDKILGIHKFKDIDFFFSFARESSTANNKTKTNTNYDRLDKTAV